MKKLFALTLMLLMALTLNPASAAIGTVQLVSEGVYSAEGTTPAGDKIYLVMERLDTSDAVTAWSKYLDASNRLTADYRGWLYDLGRWIPDPETVRTHRNDPQFADMDDAQFFALADQMAARGIFPNGERWETFNATRGGMAGFWPSENVTFVAYISTTPVKGRLPVSKAPLDTFLKIKKAYSHIVMSVGITLSLEYPVYEDRGIFRNPLSLVDGGYSNVASLLHAFAGKTIQTRINAQWPIPMEHMMVRALPEMRKILERDFGVDHIGYTEEIKAISEELIQGLAGGFGMFDTPMLINLNELVAQQEEMVIAENTKRLADRVTERIKPKGEVRILLGPDLKNAGRVVVWFSTKKDATNLAKLLETGKQAVPVHEQEGGFAVKIGPVRMHQLFKKDGDAIYAAILKELGAS